MTKPFSNKVYPTLAKSCGIIKYMIAQNTVQTVAQRENRAGAALLQALTTAQIRHDLFPTNHFVAQSSGALSRDPEPTPVVVGVSGGVDSVCLLHALLQLAQPWALALHVAHLDHALRPDSAADAEFVAQLAAQWGLPISIERLATGLLAAQAGGLEAAARRARYAFLAQVASNVTPAGKVPILVVAHHADDQAETVLLHLLRGSGLRGLGGMRWVGERMHDSRRVRLLRPLLNVTRQMILDYAAEQGLCWREDATNRQDHFLRNRLRHDIMPQLAEINPNLVATLGRMAEVVAADVARLEQLDNNAFRQLRLAESAAPMRIVLDRDGLLALERAAQRGVVRCALTALAGAAMMLGFEPVETLLEQIQASPHASGPHPLPGNLAWSVAGASTEQAARLSLHRADALPWTPNHPFLDEHWRSTVGALQLPHVGEVVLPNDWRLRLERLELAALSADWQQNPQPWRTFVDADCVGDLLLTTPRPGLRIAPLGMAGRHKSLGDFFTDRKIPPALRVGWPILLDARDASVVWVCGLAVAHAVRITATTQRVLQLRWVRGGEESWASM